MVGLNNIVEAIIISFFTLGTAWFAIKIAKEMFKK